MEKSIIDQLFKSQKDFFRTGETKDIDFRIKTLTRLKAVVQDHEKEIIKAIYADLHKDEIDTYATEISVFYNELKYAVSNIQSWVKRKKVPTPFFLLPAKSYLYKEPYGVTLIIAPWNYPFQLLMSPLIGAVAAGNTAILKPSELSSHTAAVLEKIINNHFPPEYLHVIQGALPETQALLKLPFDYIFFTGSVPVGKIVMASAAIHLTPLTLELGGKSPAIVHESANLDTAARRISFGKFMNAGQTCIAPDYVLVHESIKDAFLKKMKNTLYKFYGEDASVHPRYCRIINDRHFQRLTALMDKKKIIHGGKTNPQDRYIEPTLLYPSDWNDLIMQDEIFGPLLPIIPYTDLSDTIRTINQRPKPLALYVFVNDKVIRRRIIRDISFGGGAVNNTIMHIVSHFLPFGGVGESGMGKYHGQYSFETFSHSKSLLRNYNIMDMADAASPDKSRLMKLLVKLIK